MSLCPFANRVQRYDIFPFLAILIYYDLCFIGIRFCRITLFFQKH